MSFYMNFFLRHNDSFLPLMTFSRNHQVYQLFNENNNVPYEKIRAITRSDISRLRDALNDDIQNCNDEINNANKTMELISTFNNSINDKITAIRECQTDIRLFNNQLSEIHATEWFLNIMELILTEAIDTCYYSDESKHIDANKYIYVGIECPWPTVDDIVG